MASLRLINLDDWFKDQLDICGTTESTDTSGTLEATAAQAYIDSLPNNINHDITITLKHDGSTFATTDLTLDGKRGSGLITIIGSAAAGSWTDTLRSLSVTNCTNKIRVEDIAFGSTGLVTDNVTDVFDVDCSFAGDGITASGTSHVRVSGATVTGTPTQFVYAYDNATVVLNDNCDLTGGAFTAVPVEARGGGVVVIPHAITYPLLTTTYTTATKSVDGGTILTGGMGAINPEGIVYKSLPDAEVEYVTSAIEFYSKVIPCGAEYRVTLATTTTAAYIDHGKIYIKGFSGGGKFSLHGNGTSNTILRPMGSSDDLELEITDCTVPIEVKDLMLESITTNPNTSTPTIKIENCSAPVILDSVYIKTAYNIGADYKAAAIEIVNCPCVIIKNCNINCTGGVDVYTDALNISGCSRVFCDSNTSSGNDASTYGNNVTEGSHLGILTGSFTGGTNKNNDTSSVVTSAW